MKASNTEYDKYFKDYSKLDRAICDSSKGFMKILTKKNSPEILGATFVGGPAGDMISQVTMSLHNNLNLTKIGAAVSPYPSYTDGIKQITDQYNRKYR